MEAGEAKELDEWLMNPLGGSYTLEQLMELAGLSVAQAIAHYYPLDSAKVLILCGPGNNGGDGLVAGRHLLSFGVVESVHIWSPIVKSEHQKQLLQQAKNMGAIQVIEGEEGIQFHEYDLIVDALFGKALALRLTKMDWFRFWIQRTT